jgi:hypothetical protein
LEEFKVGDVVEPREPRERNRGHVTKVERLDGDEALVHVKWTRPRGCEIGGVHEELVSDLRRVAAG